MSTALLILIWIALVALFLYSLLGPREVWDLELGEGVLSRLNRRKDRLLRTLKDLEFERENGAISEDEFRRLRNDYKQRALRVMQELDRVRSARVRHLERGPRAISPSLRRKVEAEVKARTARDQGSQKVE